MAQTHHLSRLWFLSQGCKQAPLDAAKGLVRWGHPDGYFLRTNGTKVVDNLSPAKQNNPNTHGGLRPFIRDCCQYSHTLMLITFHGPRPEPKFNPATGKIEKFEGDHKNGDKFNYRPDNLEWVFSSENSWRFHHVLKVLRLKGIDPSTYTGPQMDHWFAIFRILEKYIPHHAQAHTRTDYLRWFNTPIDQFQTMFTTFHRDTRPTDDLMQSDMSHHMEI